MRPAALARRSGKGPVGCETMLTVTPFWRRKVVFAPWCQLRAEEKCNGRVRCRIWKNVIALYGLILNGRFNNRFEMNFFFFRNSMFGSYNIFLALIFLWFLILLSSTESSVVLFFFKKIQLDYLSTNLFIPSWVVLCNDFTYMIT